MCIRDSHEPRFSSAIPGASGFSTKASEPLRVTNILALNAIIGIAARAIRNEPDMTSLEVASSSLEDKENRSVTIDESVDPIGLIVTNAPNSVKATKDFDHSGFPDPTDAEYRETPARPQKKKVPPDKWKSSHWPVPSSYAPLAKTARIAAIFPMTANNINHPGNGISLVASETVITMLITMAIEAKESNRFATGRIVIPRMTLFCDPMNISNTDSVQRRDTNVALDSLAKFVPDSLGRACRDAPITIIPTAPNKAVSLPA